MKNGLWGKLERSEVTILRSKAMNGAQFQINRMMDEPIYREG